MKKALSIVLTLAMTAALLAGCGGSSSGGSSSSSAPAASSSAPAASAPAASAPAASSSSSSSSTPAPAAAPAGGYEIVSGEPSKIDIAEIQAALKDAESAGLPDASGAAKKTIVFSGASFQAMSEAEELWKFMVESLSGGSIAVDWHPWNELGDDLNNTTNTQFGDIQMAVTSPAPIASMLPNLYLFDSLYVITNQQMAYDVMDGEVGDQIEKDFEAAGLKIVMWCENGFRQLTCNREVTGIDSLKGMKIRTMENKFQMAGWSALGTNPTPMAFTEVFTALQQGTVDAQETPLGLIDGNSFMDVCSYLVLTNHNYTVEGLIEGESINVTVTGSQTLVGSSDNTADVAWADETTLQTASDNTAGTLMQALNLVPASSSESLELVAAADATAKAGNYTLHVVFGTLTVTDGSNPGDDPIDPNDVVRKSHVEAEYGLGDTITWNIEVVNIYDEAKTITLTEQDGVELAQSVFENVEPGATVTTTATHVVTAEDIAAGEYGNTVTASFEGGIDVPGTDPKPVPLTPAPKLDITKTASAPANGETYDVGETITYTIVVTNTGNVNLANVVVTDAMADGRTVTFTATDGGTVSGQTVTYATLNVGETRTITVTYTVVEADQGATLTNTATVTAPMPTDPDGNPVAPGDDPSSTVTTPGEKVTPKAEPKPEPKPEPKKPVKTGDDTNLAPLYMTMEASATLFLALAAYTLHRRRHEDDAA